MLTATDRYIRQEGVLPLGMRLQTKLNLLGGDAAADFARFLLGGAAGAGIELASDFHGSAAEEASHFLRAVLDEMAAFINSFVAYDYLDPHNLGLDVSAANQGRNNAWIALPINDVPRSRWILDEMIAANVNMPVLLVLSGPGGFLVGRCSCPAVALEQVDSLATRSQPISNGPPEMDVAAAGIVLCEMTNGADDTTPWRLCAYYSQHRPDRVQPAKTNPTLGDLATEIAVPVQETAPFSEHPLVCVGAGALANWAFWPIAHAQEGVRARFYDGDPEVEIHNVSRQPLVADAVGPHPKVTPMVRALQLIDQQGNYEGICRFIHSPGDIDPAVLRSSSALLSLPDNDKARVWSGDAALAAGVPLATAGSSVHGGQAVICRPDRGACVRCLLGLDEADVTSDESASCAHQTESIVSPNMVASGLLMAELRLALSTDVEPVNIRFTTSGASGNRLQRMISNPPMCAHVRAAREGK